MINGKTLAEGEMDYFKVGTNSVSIRCDEIRTNSVLICSPEFQGQKELKLSK